MLGGFKEIEIIESKNEHLLCELKQNSIVTEIDSVSVGETQEK